MKRTGPNLHTVPQSKPLPAEAQVVVDVLSQVVTGERLKRIDQIIAQRTDQVVPVLEGLTDPHNISAVLRSCDAFGIQGVHVIEGTYGFVAAHAVSRGSERWLDVVRHETALSCVTDLKSQGYSIYVAEMHGAVAVEELSSLRKVALVLGNEHRGASDAIRSAADGSYRIPMRGFVESLNVSVAAAVTLYAATSNRARESLSETQALELKARMLLRTVNDAEKLVGTYLRDRPS
ncbi:MAG: RNA methyltransferase [Myxococcota bacterium]